MDNAAVREPPHLRYRSLNDVRTLVRWLAPVLRYGGILIGLTIAAGLVMELQETNLTASERVYLGVVALVALFGLGFLGVLLARILDTGADVAEVLIDMEAAAERTAELTEQKIVPALNRLSQSLKELADAVAAADHAELSSSGAGGTAGAGRRRP